MVAEPVAVCHEKLFAFERENLWFAVYYQSDFLFEVAECPEVVVADEEVDGNAGFGYFAQFAEQPCKAFWHDGGVFEPKIEDIAEQKDGGGIGLGHFGICGGLPCRNFGRRHTAAINTELNDSTR